MMHKSCPAHYCRASVRSGQIFCRNHWFALPAEMRAEIWRTWRHVRDWRGRADLTVRQAQIAAYRAAVRRAIDAFDPRFTDIFDQREPDATIHVSPASETGLAGAMLSPDITDPASHFVVVRFGGVAS